MPWLWGSSGDTKCEDRLGQEVAEARSRTPARVGKGRVGERQPDSPSRCHFRLERAHGIEKVGRQLLDVIFATTSDSPSARNPSVARRLIEILESDPDKAKFIDFLRFHLSARSRYLGWGGPLVLNKYELQGIEFDAYAPYVGHGIRLTLVSFTQAWKDPFELMSDKGETPRICVELEQTLSKIRSIQQNINSDRQTQVPIKDDVIRSANWREDETVALFGSRERFDLYVPDLSFFVFAGRRVSIDATMPRHNSWSELLKDHDDLVIKTYDYTVDAFLERNNR
jgi:hypothetical protein